MKSFLDLSTEEQALYFSEAAAKNGRFSSSIYEKDFWVCWTLKKLFEIPKLNEYLLFKGGTSLSKVFNVIKRFSEDVDLTIHRSFFGVEGESDPENAKGNKERNRIIEKLSKTNASYVSSELLPKLQHSFGEEIKGKFELIIEDHDPQVILFRSARSF